MDEPFTHGPACNDGIQYGDGPPYVCTGECDIAPAGEIAEDGPDVVRVRVSRETACAHEWYTVGPDSEVCYACGAPRGSSTEVSRETSPFGELGVWEASDADRARWAAQSENESLPWTDSRWDYYYMSDTYRDWEDYA